MSKRGVCPKEWYLSYHGVYLRGLSCLGEVFVLEGVYLREMFVLEGSVLERFPSWRICLREVTVQQNGSTLSRCLS